jgi:3-oxoacyl-(acyl-carrier-protein) synthase/thioesterase domain-containing protein
MAEMTPEAGRAMQARLAAMLARRLGCAPGDLYPGARFSRYGASSLVVTAVLAELGRELGRPLRVTLAWEHPTLAELAAAIASDTGEPTARAPAAVEIATVPAAGDPVAIVGLAGRFPGAGSPEALFELIARGGDAVSELPADRFAAELYDRDPEAPGRASTRWAGLLDAVDRFDAAFFGISPREATHIDPQQRLVLELAWEALEDAGIPPRSLRGSRTGVFIGAMWSDYAALRRGALPAIAQHTAVGEDLSIIPARVSYTLGLEGPSLAVNTACSSSLTAVHLACQSLRDGTSELAVAGGVNALLDPALSISLSRARALSPTGRCRAFDAAGDGFVRSEGCAVIVLRRLDDAIARGDRVYAVIRGSAINNDGRSNGLTAPSGSAQRRLLIDALRAAGVEPHQVGYVEAHGTGTPLGDPIEFGALAAVFGGRAAELPPLAIGSVKTNLGHLEAAAGIAGLIKLALCVQHGTIPAQLHLTARNPHLDPDARIVIPTAATAWPAGHARRIGGVSAFGFSGTNAHVVVEQPPARAAAPAAPGAALLALSARSEPALRALARRHVERLAAAPDLALGDVCSSANTGRLFHAARHSLLAVRLAARIRARFDRELPLAGLLAHPTVAGQADALRGGGSGALPRQVACLAPGDGTPIFLIHPVGGNAICYRELAGLLRAHGPVFGIQADDTAGAPATLHELARGYVEVIRAVQPHGPYRLGGWSLGGFVAVELAGLLRAAGEPIELVFTIDSCLPIAGAAPASRPELLARFLGDLQHGAPAEPGALALRLAAAGPDACIAAAHRWALDAGLLPGELSIDAFARMFRVFERNARALLGHRPRAASPCDLAVHAFCAATVLVGHDAAGAWTEERDILHPVAGDHHSVMQPPVLHHIAERVRDALAREVRS